MSESSTLEQQVHDGLIDAELIELGEPTPTAPDAARVLNVSIDHIIKTLVFFDQHSQVILAVISGPDRVDLQKLQQVSKRPDLKLARPEEVLAFTGYPVGSMPPVAHDSAICVLVDRHLWQMDLVFGGGGVPNTMLAIRPTEIVRVTNGHVADITE